MRWSIVLAALLLAARAADAQIPTLPPLKEKVYLLADSAQWVLAYHILPDKTESCEVATREQPGALFKNFFHGANRSFTVYLLWTSAEVDSFVLQVDTKRPTVRRPSYEERTKNVLHIRGSDLGGHIDKLVGASRFRIQVFYPDREKQDLELDLTGFTPLYQRAIQLDCVPPQIIEAASCQSLRKRFSNNLSALPYPCQRSLESKKWRGRQPPF